MNDRQLTTRDLAETSDTVDGQADGEPSAPDRSSVVQSTDNRGTLGDPTASHEPPARNESENEHEDGAPPEDPAEVGSIHRGADPPTPQQTPPEASRLTSSNLERGPLLPDDQSVRFTTRWQEIQASFVDQPRDSVEQADALVADLMQQLAASFSNERQGLETQWDRGNDVSTEDLRVALTRYRSFFDRLLSA